MAFLACAFVAIFFFFLQPSVAWTLVMAKPCLANPKGLRPRLASKASISLNTEKKKEVNPYGFAISHGGLFFLQS
jgi:hypothetical protein